MQSEKWKRKSHLNTNGLTSHTQKERSTSFKSAAHIAAELQSTQNKLLYLLRKVISLKEQKVVD